MPPADWAKARSGLEYDRTKRIVDVVLAVLLLIFLTPLSLVIVLLIKLDSPGPALYLSRRSGANGTTFQMLKFRTMCVETPEIPTHLMHNLGRFQTRVGHWLRQFSLDEIPQLVNVIRGEMSLVGPRPAMTSQLDLQKLRAEQGVLHLVPGVTGWAQVNGRDKISLEQKVALDAWYAQHASMSLDLRIILLTGVKVVARSNVSH